MITLYIANHSVRRMLVDGGSLVNIILMDTLKGINNPECVIVKRSSMLIGLSGETKHTVRKIK